MKSRTTWEKPSVSWTSKSGCGFTCPCGVCTSVGKCQRSGVSCCIYLKTTIRPLSPDLSHLSTQKFPSGLFFFNFIEKQGFCYFLFLKAFAYLNCTEMQKGIAFNLYIITSTILSRSKSRNVWAEQLTLGMSRKLSHENSEQLELRWKRT
jgi:hypothetical protein